MTKRCLSMLCASVLACTAFTLRAADTVTEAESLGKIHGPLLTMQGKVDVTIRLVDPSLAELAGPGAKKALGLSRGQQTAHLSMLKAKQDKVVKQAVDLGGVELARVSKVLNAVVLSIDASALPSLAALPEVKSIRSIINYEMHLGETVPYIGATAAQTAGYDGSGVRVAVLDSGIDYTHKNLGGAGTLAAYEAAWGSSAADPRNTTLDGLFPTAKVVGGYDFVGEVWPNGALAPDPDPIDRGGHGTHVADIIGGKSLDGTHKGVAPGAKLYAFKVCSAVTTSCSGVAIMQGLEAALDPNMDGYINDAVDVVNMSLGSSYGQIQDDSAYAVQVLTQYGVTVVCSAGNSGDKPYVVGSPSIAPGAISVAQTTVPSAKAYVLQYTPASLATVTIRNTASVDWAPINTTVEAEVVAVGLACSPNLGTNSVAGKIALIDRGTCSISLKVNEAATAGAIGVIIANNVAGDPPSFSFGGGSNMVPTIVITLADGTAMKNALKNGAVTAKFGPDLYTPLVGSIVSTSSRGPSTSFQTIKPEIGAPGGSLSAEVGTGDGQTAFSGTSGAAPMVAGSAAIVLQAYPKALPAEVKARLMNSADPNIALNPTTSPGVLTPITRIGAGEVRVDKAIGLKTLAVDAETGEPSVSFGYQAVQAAGQPLKFKKLLRIENRSNKAQTYTLSAGFRNANDEASGAVALKLSQSTLSVPAGKKGTVNLFLDVNPSKLPDWTLNSGAAGGNGALLSLFEYDGYVTVVSKSETLTLPWHILPHKAADNHIVETGIDVVNNAGTFMISNDNGAKAGVTELFALTATSPQDYPSTLPWGINLAAPDLAAVGVRTLTNSGGLIQFAIATHDQRAHANYPLEVDIYVDSDNDGTDDFVIYNTETGGFAASGQNVTTVVNLTNNAAVTRYYTDADLNSSAVMMTSRFSDLRLAEGKTVRFSVYLFDNYFTGNATDGAENMLYTPGKPRFAVPAPTVEVPPMQVVPIAITYDAMNDEMSASQTGILGIHRDASPGRWFDTLRVKPQ